MRKRNIKKENMLFGTPKIQTNGQSAEAAAQQVKRQAMLRKSTTSAEVRKLA